MIGADKALVLLLAASALHCGFQLTVTVVVYPALARITPEEWTSAHDAHGRSIVGVVAIVYAALLAAIIWAPLAHPDNTWVWVAVAGAALSMGTTAVVAGPTHGRLDHHRDPALSRRLLVSDRLRTLGSLIALGAAVLAAGAAT